MGKPQDYSEEIAEEICKRLMAGESMSAVCRDETMPPRWQVYEWLAAKPEFADRYARASEIRADRVFDEIFEIADDNQHDIRVNEDGVELLNSDHVQRAKLRIDARKWALAKMMPKKYGDKIQHTGDGGGAIAISWESQGNDSAD